MEVQAKLGYQQCLVFAQPLDQCWQAWGLGTSKVQFAGLKFKISQINRLTHLPRDKMATISQMIFSDGFL